MTLKNTSEQVGLVALFYLIDQRDLVALVPLVALMAVQGMADLQDRAN